MRLLKAIDGAADERQPGELEEFERIVFFGVAELPAGTTRPWATDTPPAGDTWRCPGHRGALAVGWPQWNAGDPEGEDVRAASVRQPSVVYLANRLTRRLSVPAAAAPGQPALGKPRSPLTGRGRTGQGRGAYAVTAKAPAPGRLGVRVWTDRVRAGWWELSDRDRIAARGLLLADAPLTAAWRAGHLGLAQTDSVLSVLADTAGVAAVYRDFPATDRIAAAAAGAECTAFRTVLNV